MQTSGVFGNKAPLCKFINDCRQYKENKQCKFSHAMCRFGDKCNDRNMCKFYHPELQGKISRPPRDSSSRPTNTSTSKLGPPNTVPCKFGAKCNKKQSGQCPFNHDLPPLPSRTLSKPKQGTQQQCRFGASCNKYKLGTCRFKHSENMEKLQPGREISNSNVFNNRGNEAENGNNSARTNNNINNNSNNNNGELGYSNNNRPNNQPEIQPNINYNAQFHEYQQTKLCRAYATGLCKNQCNLSHFFTLDNSLKRTYSKTFPHALSACTFKLNQIRIYALAVGNTIAFYQLDTNLQVFKSVCQFQLRIQANISKLYAVTEAVDGNQIIYLIFTAANNRIYRYNVVRGEIGDNQYANPHNSTGVVFFVNKGLMLMGNSSWGLAVERDGQISANIKAQICGNADPYPKITVIKKFNILREEFVVVGTESGNLGIINDKMQAKSVPIANSSIIDLHATKINEKPILFIILCSNPTKYSVVAMSLLDFSYETFLIYQDSKISKICISCNRIFVGIDGVGVLVYNTQELPKIKGRIPLVGKISHIQCDSEGNLLILEQSTQMNRVSLSTYILRK